MSSSPYAPAARLLNLIWTQRKGIKTLAYNREGELTCSKVTYAQCSHVLESKPLLDQLLQEIKVDAKNEGLLYILLYELLLGPNKSIRGGGALKRQLLKHHETLKEKLGELKPESGRYDDDEPKRSTVTIPRYVRANTLVTCTEDVVKTLKGRFSFYADPHVPDVLAMPPTPETRGMLQDLVSSHQIVLQDKSSCFSALCLIHGFDTTLPNCDYLDACAAPGNKTSHLASLVSSSSCKIHALDMSKDRYAMLQRRMKDLVSAGDQKVQCHNLDFLKTSQTDFPKVQAILLDPSCSGSGMTGNHQEANRDPNYSNDRVQSLSHFQFLALKHAGTSFAKVKRIVYSTCSLYIQENEGVVQRFLESTDDEWELVAPKCLAGWKRRGVETEGLSEEQSQSLIRVHPDEDATNGFFVACFQRKGASEKLKPATWKEPTPPDGMEVYDGQFHNNDNKAVVDSIAKEEEKTLSKGGDSAVKRKADEPSTADAKVSKKRSKKMDWKRKQREKKFSRLKKKTDETNED
jgi:putative methyltransferase